MVKPRKHEMYAKVESCAKVTMNDHNYMTGENNSVVIDFKCLLSEARVFKMLFKNQPPHRGGGANTKVPDMYGVGGCFRDSKHKSNMYTFVQQRGVSIFYPESQKYKWYFCTHIS